MESIIIAILSKYNISFKLKRNGREAEFLCPFHNDRTPSMSMNTLTGKWHCFSCKAGGLSVQSFVRKLYGEDVDLSQIVNDADILQLKLRNKYQDSQERLWAFEDYIEFKRLYDEERMNFCPAAKSDIAMDYLTGPKRKLTPQTIQEFGILFAKEGYYAGRVIIPYESNGKVIGFNARLIVADKSSGKDLRYRYLVHKQGFAGFVYRHDNVVDKQTAILVEGPFDLMWMHQLGFGNVISTLSTGVSVDHLEKLIEYKNIVFCFDNDENASGDKAVYIAAKKILDISPRKVLLKANLPHLKDPNECTEEEIIEAMSCLRKLQLKEQPGNSVAYRNKNSSRWNFLAIPGEKERS